MGAAFIYEVLDRETETVLFKDSVRSHAQGYYGTMLLNGRSVHMRMSRKGEELDASEIEGEARAKYLKEKRQKPLTLSGKMGAVATQLRVVSRLIAKGAIEEADLTALVEKIDEIVTDIVDYVEKKDHNEVSATGEIFRD